MMMVMLSRRSIPLLFAGTLLLLTYVHAQTSIYRISYSIEAKERQVAALNEGYKHAKFRVAKLHSPSFLNKQLENVSLDLTAPKAAGVLHVSKSIPMGRISVPDLTLRGQVMSWFGLMREAQAKPVSD